ncbi:alpha/beta fold hydrolase [Modicisalibacter coralii]|uniref:alpha/beta fold hydrolase n=1 Tax=Modicisalibacter coralii TaxID=2304602 RepID=UPI00100B0133|nr:alpha/beta fold hydrolase [Halomonas coralii]
MTDTVALYCQDNGPEGTRPLVILHGLLGSADNWRSHAKQWQRSRRVIAVDLRNHGRSPHVAGMSYTAMAADVIALLDRLSIDDCDLLGHSMGGKVAISIAREAPRRVASLMVADIAPVAYGHGHDDIFAAMRRVEGETPTSRQAADALMAETIETQATRQFLATNLVRDDAGVMRWRVGLDEIEADYDAIIAEPAGQGAFEGATLVVRGAQSDYVPDSLLPKLREVLPRADIVTLEAGHWLHAEAPKAFRETIDAFLEHNG